MTGNRPTRTRLSSGSIASIALVFVFIACAGIAVLTLLGPAVGNVHNDIQAALSGAPADTRPASPADTRPASPPASEPAAANPGGGHDQQLMSRLIVKEGVISLIVDDPRQAREAIEQMVAQYSADGAFVVAATETGGGEDRAPTVQVTLRVPAARFEETMDRIAALGRGVQARDEKAQDVTDEYVDAQSRLSALQAAHDRLFAFMTTATTTVDLMSIEQQLTTRESEIEALKGRIQFLSQSALLSRIAVTLAPYVPPAAPAAAAPEPWWLDEVWRYATTTLESTARGVASTLIVFGIVWLPWLAIVGLLVWAGRLAARR